MGRRELGIKKLKIDKFDLGYFPNKHFDDVPAGGSPNCRHVFHKGSALRPFPGMDLVNSIRLTETTGLGMHHININGLQKRVAVFGSKLYYDLNGVWTDITGPVSISSGEPVKFVDHQEGANKYVIGVQKNSAAFKWTGSGTAELLGGSPPAFSSITKYHEAIFGSVNEYVYFSETTDPEDWDRTNRVIRFDKDVNVLLDHGSKIAVLMDDHIGSIQGFDYLDLEAQEREITTFGCVGKHAATNCSFGTNDLKVISTIAQDGVWFFDQAFNANKILGDDYFSVFNQRHISKSSMAYWRAENLLFVALPYSTSTDANYLIIINTRTGAFWPGPDIHGNYIRSLSSMRDDNGDEFIYFQDTNGYAYKFNMATNWYHTGSDIQDIDYRWVSKRYDLEDVHSLGDIVMLADAVGDWSLVMGINFGLLSGDGSTGSINLGATGDLIGSTFIISASVLSGTEYAFETLDGVGGFGRFVQIILSNSSSTNADRLTTNFVFGSSQLPPARNFRVRMIEVNLHNHRMGGNDP